MYTNHTHTNISCTHAYYHYHILISLIIIACNSLVFAYHFWYIFRYILMRRTHKLALDFVPLNLVFVLLMLPIAWSYHDLLVVWYLVTPESIQRDNNLR